MKHRFTNGLCNPGYIAASALVGALSIVTGQASAQQVTYIPHRELTPYQFVLNAAEAAKTALQSDKCLQVVGNDLRSSSCNALDNTQKFYLLDFDLNFISDYKPVKAEDNANARIIVASEFDKILGGGYSFLHVNNGGLVAPTQTAMPMPARDSNGFSSWRINQFQWESPMVWVANEGSQFTLTGSHPREVFYGAGLGSSDWNRITVQMSSAEGGKTVNCDNATFGDPAYGVVKQCMLEDPDKDPKWKKMAIVNKATGTCLASQILGGDSQCYVTLRATSYPK